MGAPVSGTKSADQPAAETLLTAFKTINAAERRKLFDTIRNARANGVTTAAVMPTASAAPTSSGASTGAC